MSFALFSVASIAIGFIAWCILFAFLKDEDFLTSAVLPLLIFLVISIGGVVIGTIIFEEEIEIEAQESECKQTCDSKGLEFVGYENQECFCREPKFTLVNGGSNG